MVKLLAVYIERMLCLLRGKFFKYFFLIHCPVINVTIYCSLRWRRCFPSL